MFVMLRLAILNCTLACAHSIWFSCLGILICGESTAYDILGVISVKIGGLAVGVCQWRSQGGARGAIAPPFFKNNVIKTFVIDVR